jgi:hypothetical protein
MGNNKKYLAGSFYEPMILDTGKYQERKLYEQ